MGEMMEDYVKINVETRILTITLKETKSCSSQQKP